MVNISGGAIRDWILRNLSSNSIIVEAGTADGNDTLFFSNYFKDGKIYGFEPEPTYYNKSLEKVGGRSNVEMMNMALSDRSGTAKFYVSDCSGEICVSSSLLKPKEHLRVHTSISFSNQIDVKTVNLYEWFQAKGLNHIDLLWLDMQGAEPMVLRNAPITLSKTRYLYTEVSLIDTYENVEKYESFKVFLNENGFDVMGEELPWVDMGNILLKNRNMYP